MGAKAKSAEVGAADWSVSWTFAANAITQRSARDVAPVRSNVGIYDLTLGSGGVDHGHTQMRVAQQAGAALSCKVVHTSDTVKQLRFYTNAHVLADPDAVTVTFRRLPQGG